MTSHHRPAFARGRGAAPCALLLALALALGLALASAACGAGDAPPAVTSPAATATTRATAVHAPTATPSPIVTPTPIPTRPPRDPDATVPVFTSDIDGAPADLDPCGLLDPAEISELTGVTAGGGQPGGDAGSCSWPLGATGGASSLVVTVMSRLDARDQLSPDAVPIVGVGDDAWWDGTALTVVTGDLAFDLILARDASENTLRELSIAIAALVVDRLG